MAHNGNIQYVADTVLLEKILRIEEGITKQAGLVDTFRSVAQGIKDQVAQRVEQDGLGITLVNYLAPAVLGRIWPPFGILAAAASFYGVNIGQIMNGMMNSLKSKIESGQLLTMNEINDAGKQVAGGDVDPFVTQASNDFFYYLRELEKRGELTRLVREAQSMGTVNRATPFLGGTGGILAKIFGNVGRLKGKWLLIGIIVWFVKTVLLGAGLVEGTESVAKGVGINKPQDKTPGVFEKSDSKPNEQTKQEFSPISINIPQSIPHGFKPSGQGQQYHINDGQSIWIVPLVGGNVAETLLGWAASIYPETSNMENEIRNTKTFNNLVSMLSGGISNESPNYLTVPKGLHSRKDIVDKFVGSVFSKVNKDQNEI